MWPRATLTAVQVRILFFGTLKELTGKVSDTVDLPENASIRDLLRDYETHVPELRKYLPSVAVAVNQQYAGPETKLNAGDEVALLPPVSGGAPDDAPLDIVIFDGIVRNHSRNRKTLYLEYEAYETMALGKLRELADEALRRFAIRNVALVHRLGHLEIGESSVLIAVFSAHRAAAFDACRWLIDTLKRTVPIWKKEYFEDGAVWADGEPFPAEIPRANSQGSTD
jgi:MoaE-MoaD fusion protein